MKVTIVGIGYIEMSNAVLLAQHNEVIVLDILDEKVKLISKGISPISDKELEEYLVANNLNLTATTQKENAYVEADYFVISTPTNYDVNEFFSILAV